MAQVANKRIGENLPPRVVARLQERAEIFRSRAQLRALRAAHLAKDAIHQNPLGAVLAGIGAGWVVGTLGTLLLVRRRLMKE